MDPLQEALTSQKKCSFFNDLIVAKPKSYLLFVIQR